MEISYHGEYAICSKIRIYNKLLNKLTALSALVISSHAKMESTLDKTFYITAEQWD
jgi:hypothetical protein